MKPTRTETLRRRVGVFFTLFSVLFSILTSGCLLLSDPKKSPDFTLSDDDACRAGALALYSKGLLLESGDGNGDTNAAKEAACQAFRQAAQLDPDNRRPLAALISNLADRERYDDALRPLESFLKRHPEDLDMRLEAARIADAAGRPSDAARHCSAILAAHPDNREMAHVLIRLHFQSSQDAAALATVREQYLRFHDRDSLALPVQWAVFFTHEGKNPKLAVQCLNIAIGQRTNAVERAALIALTAENQLMLGQTNAAVASLHRSYSENPSYTLPIMRLGALWAQRPDATNQLARMVDKQNSQTEPTLLILAATQQALGDSKAAVASLRAFYASRMRAGYFPDESYYLWLGGLLEEQPADHDVQALYSEALATHPSSHEIKNFVAYLWAENGIRLDEANRLVNESLKADPDNAAYLDTKGWILFKRGYVFDALQFLLRAAEGDKEEPVILDHVGDALSAAGRDSEALTFWKRSHQIEPKPAIAEKLRAHGVDVSPKK